MNQINEEDVDKFSEVEENQNTKRKTEPDVNLRKWKRETALHVNGPPRVEELSPSELDTQENEILVIYCYKMPFGFKV